MRKTIVMLSCLFLISGLLLFGCESETKRNKKKLQQEKSEQFMKDFMARDHKERVALLSIKYNVEENTLESILDEYLINHDFTYGLKKSIDKKEKWDIHDKMNLNFTATLSMLSNKHKLSKETLASIIIDYKSLESKGSGG